MANKMAHGQHSAVSRAFFFFFLSFKRQWNWIELKHIGGEAALCVQSRIFIPCAHAAASLTDNELVTDIPPRLRGWMWKVARQQRWNVALFNERRLVDVVLNRSTANLAEPCSSLFDANIILFDLSRRGGGGLKLLAVRGYCRLRHSLAMQALK